MEGYILIVLQILITGLIIWRRKQDSKEPSGCLAAGVIFMIVFALTTALFSLGHLIINEGLFANIFAESRGSLAAASPMEWLMAGFICLIMMLVSATVCSLAGYAVTGRHPKFCKLIWKTLAIILLFPVMALGILVAAFGFAYIICMRFASPMFDNIGWGWMEARKSFRRMQRRAVLRRGSLWGRHFFTVSAQRPIQRRKQFQVI